MVRIAYGERDAVSSLAPTDRLGLLAIYLDPSNDRTPEELKQIVVQEIFTRASYIPAIDQIVLGMHEKYWMPDFIADFEKALPESITHTVVRLTRPGTYELSFSFKNARATLDGFLRRPGDDRAPLYTTSQVSISFDALVESPLDLLHLVLRFPNLGLLKFLPAFRTSKPRQVYFDALVLLLPKLHSSTYVDLSCLRWTVEETAELKEILAKRPI